MIKNKDIQIKDLMDTIESLIGNIKNDLMINDVGGFGAMEFVE